MVIPVVSEVFQRQKNDKGRYQSYKITIKERNKKKESISFSQVNLAFKDDGKLEGIKAQQKGYAWILHYSSLRIIEMRLH